MSFLWSAGREDMGDTKKEMSDELPLMLGGLGEVTGVKQ